MTTHTCPGRCGRQVPPAFYACRTCWFRLPSELRSAIIATQHLNSIHPKRLRALNDAGQWLREQEARL